MTIKIIVEGGHVFHVAYKHTFTTWSPAITLTNYSYWDFPHCWQLGAMRCPKLLVY